MLCDEGKVIGFQDINTFFDFPIVVTQMRLVLFLPFFFPFFVLIITVCFLFQEICTSLTSHYHARILLHF